MASSGLPALPGARHPMVATGAYRTLSERLISASLKVRWVLIRQIGRPGESSSSGSSGWECSLVWALVALQAGHPAGHPSALTFTLESQRPGYGEICACCAPVAGPAGQQHLASGGLDVVRDRSTVLPDHGPTADRRGKRQPGRRPPCPRASHNTCGTSPGSPQPTAGSAHQRPCARRTSPLAGPADPTAHPAAGHAAARPHTSCWLHPDQCG